jgi:hypothetical protein
VSGHILRKSITITQFRDPTLSCASVAPTSQVRVSTKLLLPIVKAEMYEVGMVSSDITFIQNAVKTGQAVQKLNGGYRDTLRVSYA